MFFLHNIIYTNIIEVKRLFDCLFGYFSEHSNLWNY